MPPHDRRPDGRETPSPDVRHAVVILPQMPEPVADATVNELRERVLLAIARRPRTLELDLSLLAKPDSRFVALTCDALRLCRDARVRFTVRCSPELRDWLVVYHIPKLRRVLVVTRPPHFELPPPSELPPAGPTTSAAA